MKMSGVTGSLYCETDVESFQCKNTGGFVHLFITTTCHSPLLENIYVFKPYLSH